MQLTINYDAEAFTHEVRKALYVCKRTAGNPAKIRLGMVEMWMVLGVLLQDGGAREGVPTLWGVPIELKAGTGYEIVTEAQVSAGTVYVEAQRPATSKAPLEPPVEAE